MKRFLIIFNLFTLFLTSSILNAENTYDVIVVGAGIAGLAAATELQKMHYKVLILEGRNRIGGRIWTEHAYGLAVDLGANWIQGINKNPIAELSATLKLDLIVSDMSAAVYNSNGALLSTNAQSDLWKIENKFSNFITHFQKTSDQDVSLQTLSQRFVLQEHLANESLKKFNYITGSVIELEYAADLNDLSALYYDQDESFSGDEVILPKGYGEIPDYLAKSLDIHLNEPVKEINYQNDTLTVKTENKSFSSHYVICTVPLGVLKNNTIKFIPDLPAEKKRAISRLGMGTLDKLVLIFDHVFWDKDKAWIGYIPNQGKRWLDFFNLYHFIKQPILIVFNQGVTAKEMESWPDEKIIASAMDTLKIIYGKDIPMPIHHEITRWSADRFSYGSYSHIPVGATGEDYEILGKTINGKLFFAGEATSRMYPSTVHGAYLTGLRVANEINKYRKVKTSS